MILLLLLCIFGTNVGGNGGKGGDVILECSPTIWDLSGLQHHVVSNYLFDLPEQNIA